MILIKSRGQDKCSKCGYNICFGAIHFHHLDPTDKKYNISDLMKGKITDKKIAELNKCIPLCVVCHRELLMNSLPIKSGYQQTCFDEWTIILHDRGQDKCSICGYNKYIGAIDMHHNNPDEKEYPISDLKRQRFKPEHLKELDKCTSLCANCHIETHEKMKITILNPKIIEIGAPTW